MHRFVEVLHRRREAMQPSLDLRKRYLEATTAEQQRIERNAIMGRIFRLQPGPRKAFLAARLEALNAPLNPELAAATMPRVKVTIAPTTRRRYTKKSVPRGNEGTKP